MPKQATKFKRAWLNEPDGQGGRISDWCRLDSDGAWCFVCETNVFCSNMGITQVRQHAGGKKHLQKLNSEKASSSQATLFNSTSSSSTSTSLSISCLSHDQKVTRAEIIWTCKSVCSNYSFNSASDFIPTLRAMLGNSPILEDMSLAATKMTYLAADGIGPQFHQDMLTEVAKANVVTIAYDETPNVEMKNQLDIWLRYFCEERGIVVARFLRSEMLGHTTADIVSKQILKCLHDDGITLRKVMAVSSDGPNVTKKIWKLMDSEKIESCAEGLLDVGTCALHIVHNSYGKGLDTHGQAWETFAINVFHFFKSGARREDYRELQVMLDECEKHFLKHVKCRWLTLVPVLQRVRDQHEVLKRYIDQLYKSDNKMDDNNKRFRELRRQLAQKDHILWLEFLIEVGSLMQPFLTFFQGEGPLIHKLYDKMSDLVVVLLKRFIKPTVIDAKTMSELKQLDLSDAKSHLHHDKVEIGQRTRTELNSMTSAQAERNAHINKMKAFYAAVAGHLLKTLPFGIKLLKDVRCLQPLGREKSSTVSEIRRIGEVMPSVVIKDTEVSVLTDEWKLYQVEAVLDSWTELRIDQYWSKLFAIKLSTGDVKYKILPRVVKACMTLPHGNADLERGFSVNARALTKDKACMDNETLNGIRNIKDHFRTHDIAPHELTVTRRLLESAKSARRNYELRLAQKRQKETEKSNEEGKRLVESTTKSIADLEKLSDEKKMERILAKERDAIATLKANQILLHDGNQKLADAMKSKDFAALAAAQAMLDTAMQKSDSSQKSLEKLRGERLALAKKRQKPQADTEGASSSKRAK